PAPVTPEGVRDLYAVLLGRPDARLDDSFVSLGGDSLSFVEVSSRLGRLLGGLPTRWHERSITELAGAGTTRRRLSAPVEMSAVLRGLAILMVLVTHVDLAQVAGGAHVLLAVVGFNLARFGGAVAGHRARVRRLLRSAALVALPAVIWIGTIAVVTGQYRPATVLLLNGSLGGEQWTDQWHFWFLEAAVWSTVAIALALAVGPISRWQREQRFAAPVVVLVGAVALRWCTTGIETSETERYSTLLVLWCVAAGWAAAEARTTAQRATVVALATIGSLGFFGDVQRELIVVAGIALLLWARPVSVPRAVASAVRVVGGASLWIYLTHWQVYPPLEDAGYPVAALVVSIALGVLAWWAYGRVEIAVRKLLQSQAGRSSASTIR
ncbi:MAG: acyltransferase family protein, partial [Microbacterium sp.]